MDYIFFPYMFGEGQETYRQVVDLVEQWRPCQTYGHERKLQTGLQQYLEENLNSSGGLLGSEGNYVVSTERGTSRGDVVVDDVVGIELKREFDNSQKKKLRGQLEDYADNYPFVIACACGINDIDGWRELENKFRNRRGGLGGGTEFTFIHKRKENFGTQPDDGGLLGDDFLGGL